MGARPRTIPAKTKKTLSRVFKSWPPREPFGVVSQDSGFGLLGNILAPANGLGDVGEQPVPVGIVGSEKNFIVADALDYIRKGFLFGFRGKKPIALFYILAWLVFTQRRFDLASFLPFLIHPFHPIGNPADAAFKKAHAQLGKPFGDAAVHQAGKLNKSFHRSANGVHKNETIEAVFAGRSSAPVMHAARH